MRHSVAANRTSHAASLNSQANSATAASKLLEKKKEFDAVSALERASTLYLERIEGLGEDCDIMADAGRAHGQVLEQWPKMFQILNLFLGSPEQLAQKEGEPLSSETDGRRLVRIAIEDLQDVSAEREAPS